MKESIRLVSAMLLGALGAIAVNTFAQGPHKATCDERMDQIAPLLTDLAISKGRQSEILESLPAELAELKRENQELKTLVIAVSR